VSLEVWGLWVYKFEVCEFTSLRFVSLEVWGLWVYRFEVCEFTSLRFVSLQVWGLSEGLVPAVIDYITEQYYIFLFYSQVPII